MRIAILGAPGSGKGTQAKLLAARHRVARVSVGGLLREAAATEGKLDRETGEAVKAGRPVSDETVLALLEERLRARDSKRGFIIDGFPPNIPRAQALDTLLGMLGWALQIAVHIEVDDKALVKRITGRLGCEQCGAVYNRHGAPPKTRGRCDDCGGQLVSLNAGNARTAAAAIARYHEASAPLLVYYKAQHKLRTVAAGGDIEEVHQKICGVIDLEIRPLEVKTLDTAADTSGEEINTIIAGGQINRLMPEDRPESAVDAPETPSTVEAGATAGEKAAGKAAKKPAAKKTAGGKAGGKTRTSRPKKAAQHK